MSNEKIKQVMMKSPSKPTFLTEDESTIDKEVPEKHSKIIDMSKQTLRNNKRMII